MYKLYITMFIRKIKKKSGTYLAKVESYRDDQGKIKQRVIQYFGKEIDGKAEKRVLTKDIQATNVKQSLDVLAIDKIAEEIFKSFIQYEPRIKIETINRNLNYDTLQYTLEINYKFVNKNEQGKFTVVLQKL